MAFSDTLCAEARPIWEAIHRHPFLRELVAGTLPLEKFRFFLAQDWHYLDAFARTAGLLVGRARATPDLERLTPRLAKPVEKPLHRKLFDLAGLTEAAVTAVPIAPTTRAYTNHLLVAGALGSPGEAVAALLPCPWTYDEIGRRLPPVSHPVYGEWAAFYREGFLRESVGAWRSLLDEAAAEAGPFERERLREAFLTSSRYEYAFWDMAHRMEGWPV